MKSFEEIIGNAQKLMLDEDFNRKVNAKAATMNPSKGRGGTPADLAKMEREVFGYTSMPSQVNEASQPAQPQYQQQPYYQPAAPTAAPRLDYRNIADKKMQERITANGQSALDRLPAALRESIKKTPLMSNDSWPIDENGNPRQPAQASESINETYVPVQQPIIGGSGTIDYGVIKAIVNECLREHSKTLLKETISGFHIADGNVIQFVDKKGNLFEGTLKLKKKAKK